MQIDTTTYRSPNYNRRPVGMAIAALVIHTTEGAWPSDIQWLCNPQPHDPRLRVSCHYVVSPTGSIHQPVDDKDRAWHAGVGTYQGRSNWNDFSIGIEVSHIRGTPWAPAQRPALAELCRTLMARYRITSAWVVAHRWIAPDRKVDPTDWPDAELRDWICAL